MTSDVASRIARLASDRESGASEILDEALAILRDALSAGGDVAAVAGRLCGAQPSMASIWNAAVAALASGPDLERFNRFALRVARAPEALARFAVECFATGDRVAPLRLVTLSFSRTVAAALEAIARTRPLNVACSESRPALEGRRLAARLAAARIPVAFFSDAAVGHALGGADAVLVGADAVTPDWFLNKSGTRMLSAAAAQQAVPVHVIASRDKFLGHALASRLELREGTAGEIWDGAPAGVIVRNPYFESTPLDLVTSLITDAGVLGVGMVGDVCEALEREIPPGLMERM